MNNPTQTIEVVITPAGEIRVQTRGFAGSSCRQASLPLERALGLLQSDTPTAELYPTQAVPESEPLRQGNA